MAALKEEVREVLLGTTDEPQLSQLTRAAFMKHAQKDEATGEFFLNEESFIDAVAPESEDYVSNCACNVSRSKTGRANGASATSTRSNVTSTASYFKSPTARGKARSASMIGVSSRTCSRNQTPNTKSSSVSSTRRA